MEQGTGDPSEYGFQRPGPAVATYDNEIGVERARFTHNRRRYTIVAGSRCVKRRPNLKARQMSKRSGPGAAPALSI